MAQGIDHLVLEHLKKIQAEQTASRERDAEIMARLGHIENGLARIARDEAASYSEFVQHRHAVDKLRERLDRIEKRLDLVD
ncbi:MAG: hypothetical protein KGL18_05395 [Burkholderiales bacterium]|nr:hypothetical protein [Burkholderiales bacterium]MDE1926674.1 hypothetical protein [Burkholderiales bacterium]MDE2158115.1 hypothetical protein [Burkholderiales bacterium]MDE2502395.1 hypothetical protein [Burkholderiales bacterium]